MLIRAIKDDEFDLFYNEVYRNTIEAEIKYNNMSMGGAELIFNVKVLPILKKCMVSEDHFIYAIEHDNKYCGHLWLRLTKELSPEIISNGLVLMNIFLQEEFRGRKWSNDIMSFVDSKCKELKLNKIYLGVFYNDEIAVNLYKKSGFKPSSMDMVKYV